MTAHDRARMHLVQALTRTDRADVAEHIEAALEELDAEATSLAECPTCHRVGLPEQIGAHDCGR